MIFFLFSLISFTHASSPNDFFSDLENFKNKNLNLQTENQNLAASSDLLLSRKLFWTPKLSVSLDKNNTRLNNVSVVGDNDLSANLSLNLFRGGADWNSFKDAKAQKNAQELQVQNEFLKVEVKASDLIFKSLYLSETQRIEEKLLKLKEESFKIVKDRYNQGKLPLQEVTKSEVDLTQQRNKLRTAVLDLSENRSQINSLFISVVETKAWPFNEKTSPKLTSSSKLPIVEQKYWLSQSREEVWKAAKGSHWPSIDLKLQYLASPIKDSSNKQLISLITLSFPIWNQYETSAQVSSSYAQYIGALNEYKDAEQSLDERSKFLKEKIETARLNLYESKRNLDLSKKLYEDILKSFRLGRISTNDLILEQNRLLESENNLALSQLTFHQGIIEACTLAGIKSSECLQ